MPTLVMFHGGGWMMGDIGVHRRFYSNIAAHLNMVVVSPGYGFISRTPGPGASETGRFYDQEPLRLRGT